MGNSTVVSYIESAAGVAEGAKFGIRARLPDCSMLSVYSSPADKMIGEGYSGAQATALDDVSTVTRHWSRGRPFMMSRNVVRS